MSGWSHDHRFILLRLRPNVSIEGVFAPGKDVGKSIGHVSTTIAFLLTPDAPGVGNAFLIGRVL